MRVNVLALLVLPLALAACPGGDDETDTDVSGFTHPSLELTGNVTDGQTVYTSNCSTCHAEDGTGGAGSDLTAVLPGDSVEDVTQAVVEGIDGTSMVSYDGTLSDQEIADVVAYIRSEFGGN